MKKEIENPKVFISYAWGTENYQQKVMAFATSLVGDGIDVVLDKWNLEEGNDTYAFMEKCVTDESITNVLILLDPIYAKKANERSGGVGTETQIISAEVYGKVNQDKFLPVVFEKSEAGEICKPVYLKNLLHFDLSEYEKYNEEYQRLVKRLYGVEIYNKPNLGQKPKWVDSTISITAKSIAMFDELKKIEPQNIKQIKFSDLLNDIKSEIIEYKNNIKSFEETDEEYINFYYELQLIRDKFLYLLSLSIYIENSEKIIASFMEDLYNENEKNVIVLQNLKRILIHEILVYIIAYYSKHKQYDKVNYLLGKTYFPASKYRSFEEPEHFTMFYSDSYRSEFEEKYKAITGKNYYSATAHCWINTINIKVCNKEEFVFADVLCYNYCLFSKTNFDWAWFPISYIYDNCNSGMFSMFARKMVSREFATETISVFGYSSLEEFKRKLDNIKDTEFKDYRYSGVYNAAPVLSTFIKSDKFATLN
ncbi:MAG: TIR domain-containing protein [Clostridia bacterium]|nr:TIR domain-containing protein [Clostridia bacterium]